MKKNSNTMDPSDLFDAINNYEAIVVVDEGKDFAFQKEEFLDR